MGPRTSGQRTILLADERVVVTPHVAGLTDVTYREICVGPAAAAVAILLAASSLTRRASSMHELNPSKPSVSEGESNVFRLCR